MDREPDSSSTASTGGSSELTSVLIERRTDGGKTTADLYQVDGTWHWQYAAWAAGGFGTELWSSDHDGVHVGEDTREAAAAAAATHYAFIRDAQFTDWGHDATLRAPWRRAGLVAEQSAAQRREEGWLRVAHRLGSPGAVIDACLSAMKTFDLHGWPVDYSAWSTSLRDAVSEIERDGARLLRMPPSATKVNDGPPSSSTFQDVGKAARSSSSA